ncbi:MAG: hypothetical protein RIK00_13460, partial [Algiphilus sp.]|uniref:hypothetical protein n=1 Tax=Algiphilus sp. TaxID=1872431 RepID=UPI0032F044B8
PTSCRDRTLISTACSKLNMGGQKAAILAQVGQIYFGAVGQFYIGANKYKATPSNSHQHDA